MRRVLAVLAVFLGVLLVVAPVTVRNFVVGDDLVLITSNLGLNFFVGNNPDAHGYYQKPKGLDFIKDPSGSEVVGILLGRELKPSEVSRFWLGKALTFVRSQPGAFLRLTMNKFLFFWNAYEIPQAENVDFFRRFAPVLRWPLLGFSVLGPLGLLGMALSWGRWRRAYFLLTFVLSLMVVTVLFFVISRLRLQVCSVLMVFAAYALVWLWGRFRAKEIRRLAVAVLGLVSLALLVNWPHPALNPNMDLAKSHNFLAMHLLKSGDLQGAFQECERAWTIYPKLGETYVNLANLFLVQGKTDKALNLYEKSLQVDPQVSSVHWNLGNFYAQKGMWDEAISEYRAEITSSPYNVKAYEALLKALKDREKLRSSPEEDSNSSPHR